MRKQVKVLRYNDELRGIVSVSGVDYQVSGTIIGEEVDVDVTPKSARLIKVISPSNVRVKPKCPIYNDCGGCQLMHLDYEAQLRAKTDKINTLFKGIPFDQIYPCIGMKDPYHYRTKNQMVIKSHPHKKLICGMYQEATHQVIDVENCYIQDELSNKIFLSAKELAIKMHLPAYDEDKKYGLIRHILVKRSITTGETMVVVVTSTPVFPGRNNFIQALRARHPEITTIIQNINPRSTSVILGDQEQIIYGKGFIIDKLGDLKFKISSKSFYQVNPIQTQVLYSKAIELAKLSKDETIMDAYSGVGTIGLFAASKVKEVISVELVKEAHLDALGNAKANNITNVRFFNDDATNFIENYVKKKAKVDAVIMDPPRSGSDERFLKALLSLEPTKIVYISCNPVTQVTDIKQLISKYKVKYIQPVDMFPFTAHVENIVLLEKK